MSRDVIRNKIINDAIEYILNHVWDEISLEQVAEHCHLSKFYFSRIFKEQTGMSVYAFIQKVRMEQSAMKLKMESDKSITNIGLDYGYSASNFNSAFHKYHHKSPVVFRRELNKQHREDIKRFHELNQAIRIETHPDYHVIYERAIGEYGELKEAWCQFIEKHKNDITEDTIFFERTFDDPTITEQGKCIYDICMSIDEQYVVEEKNTCVLTGGKFVVYPFKGYIQEIFPLHQELVGLWFPFSHNEIDNRYSYDLYHVVKENDYMEFDICIPVK